MKEVNHGISGTKLSVAIKSSQKKKLYLKSSSTQLFNSSSNANRANDATIPISKYTSVYLVVNHTLMSSPTNANKVVTAIKIVINDPFTIPLIC
jgi:hypothetical protein